MEPEGSLPFSQEPTGSAYPEPDESTLHLPVLLRSRCGVTKSQTRP